jgi:soluble lytic murein transglycosylase-like protein
MKIFQGLLLILLGAGLAHYFFPYVDRLKEQSAKDNQKSYAELVLKSFQKNQADNDSRPATQNIAQCIAGASKIYQIPSDVLIGIMYVEGGYVGQEVGPNLNGSYDLGPMQINSLWVPQLAKLWQVDNYTAYNSVRDIGCENIYVGAWILKQGIAETGTLHKGIAHYHSATPELGAAYVKKVVAMMEEKGLSFPR